MVFMVQPKIGVQLHMVPPKFWKTAHQIVILDKMPKIGILRLGCCEPKSGHMECTSTFR